LKIYLDCCCYNRPFDDQTQERIYQETQIIMGILRGCQSGNYEIIGSSALSMEIDRIGDPAKRQCVSDLYTLADSYVNFDESIEVRAKEIASQSKIRTYDSSHIALAEKAGVDVMITTDDKLERMASHLQLNVEAVNPFKFLIQYMYGGEQE